MKALFKLLSRVRKGRLNFASSRFEGGWSGFFPLLIITMPKIFEPYQAINQSRMEPWRAEITQMRSVNWPYRKIAEWLADEAEIRVSLQAVQQFCKVRGITKSGGAKPPPPGRKSDPGRTKPRSTKRKTLFEYDGGDTPIDLSKLKSER